MSDSEAPVSVNIGATSGKSPTDSASSPAPQQATTTTTAAAAAPLSNGSPKLINATMSRRASTALVMLLMLYYFFAGTLNSLFQYHPIMMAVAFVALMPEIIHAANGLKRSKNYQDRLARIDQHMYLAFAMKVSALIGFLVIYANKNKRGKHHFVTWHGKIGGLAVTLVVAQVFIGAMYHWRLVSSNQLGRLRKAHKYLGIAILALGGIAFLLGMFSNWAAANIHNPIVNGIFSFSVIIFSGWAYFRE